ncbi:MAG TPA: hypothetical protein VKE42_07420, partial [Candidatus Cybelea sp.]|nr:hypothetical protein [Candidatus Cybelea sp.]
MISKRDDTADDNVPHDMPEWEVGYWKALGPAALRHAIDRRAEQRDDAEDMRARAKRDRDDARRNMYRDIFLGKLTAAQALGIEPDASKSFAADAEGDEATRADEEVPADELDGDGEPPQPDGASDGVPAKHRPVSFDTVGGQTITARNERALARWLSVQERISKSTEDPNPMSTNLNLSDVVKAYGITALAKHMVSEGTSFGVSEEDLTKLATEHASRAYPNDRPDVAFAKFYSSDEGTALRQAIEIAKSAPMQGDSAAEAEAAAACRELQKIGNERWPSLTPAQRFARAA